MVFLADNRLAGTVIAASTRWIYVSFHRKRFKPRHILRCRNRK